MIEREGERERGRGDSFTHFAQQARLMRDSFKRSRPTHSNIRAESRGRRRRGIVRMRDSERGIEIGRAGVREGEIPRCFVVFRGVPWRPVVSRGAP